MRKLSQINELWSKGMNRSKSNNVRIGDRLDSNLYDLKPIDMGDGYFIADDDLMIDDSKLFTFDEVLNYKRDIEQAGWIIPTTSDIEEIFLNNDNYEFKCDDIDGDILLKNLKTKKEVLFRLNQWYGETYWTSNEIDSLKAFAWKIFKLAKGNIKVNTDVDMKKYHQKVRLIKKK